MTYIVYGLQFGHSKFIRLCNFNRKKTAKRYKKANAGFYEKIKICKAPSLAD